MTHNGDIALSIEGVAKHFTLHTQGGVELAVLLVTHDLGVARLLSHRMIVMKDGAVVESGLTDQILDDPQDAYTQLLVSSILPP